MLQYDWPGNVRELQNVIQRYITGEPLEFINGRQTPSLENGASTIGALSLHDAVDVYEKRLIAGVLAQYQGNTEQSAAMLNVPLRTLYGKIKKYRLR